MSVARTIALFRNDIMITIRDAESKGKDRAEIEHRVMSVWGVTLADMGM